MRQFFVKTLLVVATFVATTFAQSDPPLLLRFPMVSRTQIVFTYGGNLWIVSRDGGDARRLTTITIAFPADARRGRLWAAH